MESLGYCLGTGSWSGTWPGVGSRSRTRTNRRPGCSCCCWSRCWFRSRCWYRSACCAKASAGINIRAIGASAPHDHLTPCFTSLTCAGNPRLSVRAASATSPHRAMVWDRDVPRDCGARCGDANKRLRSLADMTPVQQMSVPRTRDGKPSPALRHGKKPVLTLSGFLSRSNMQLRKEAKLSRSAD